MTSHRFSRWRPQRGNSTSTSNFVFGDFAKLERSKSTCIPNFGDISQFTVEILLLPVSWNKHLPCWNSTSRFDFHLRKIITITLCISLPDFMQSVPPTAELWHHSDFQDGGHGISILLPVSFFLTSLIWEGRNLHADQISARCLNPRLRYYYFRFLKTNFRHVGILRPVPIFTFAWSSACHSASAYQMSSKSDHPWRSYDVISTVQDGGHDIAILLPVSVFVISLIW